MKFAFYISKRYMFSKNKKSIISKISTIAIFTTALSIMMPLLMLSLMNGFHESIETALMENEFHIKIIPQKNFYFPDKEHEDMSHKDWYDMRIHGLMDAVKELNEHPDIKDAQMPDGLNSEDFTRLIKLRNEPLIESSVYFVEGEGLIKTPLEWRPVMIKGMSDDIMKSEQFKNNIHIDAGEFAFEKDYKVMIGKKLAEKLEIDINDVEDGKGQFVDIITDTGESNAINPKIMPQQVSAIYTSGYMEIDASVIFTTAKRAMQLLEKNHYKGIGIKLKDPAYITSITRTIKEILDREYGYKYVNVYDGTFIYTAQFKAFDWEKNMFFFVVGIMILAAFLTIFITLNILVINKKEEIGILRSMGANARTVKLIFLIQGFLIGIVGSTIGIVLGIFITSSINEIAMIGQSLVNTFLEGLHQTPLYDLLNIGIQPGEFNVVESSNVLTGSNVSYVIYISDMIIILTGAIFTSMLAAYFPSSKASKENIVDVIRYE